MKKTLLLSLLALSFPATAGAKTLHTASHAAPAPICIPGIQPDRLVVSGATHQPARAIHHTVTSHRTVAQDYSSACASFLSRRGAAVSCPKTAESGHVSFRFTRRGKDLLTFTATIHGCWWLSVEGRADLGTAPLPRTPFLPLLQRFVA